MAAKGYFAHTSPDGHDPWYWFTREGYAYTYAGENLAVDFTDSAIVEEAWMNSPEHRANLLNGNYTEVGIAIAEGTFEGHPTTFVAEEFGTPASVPTTFSEVAPASVAPPPGPTATSTPTHPAVAGVTAKKGLLMPAKATTTPAAGPSMPTSTPVAAVGDAAPPPPAPASEAPWWAGLLTSPSTVLGFAYYALAVATLLIFAYMTELELHKRHLRHAAEAGGLLLLMLLLFTLADFLFFAHPVLAAF